MRTLRAFGVSLVVAIVGSLCAGTSQAQSCTHYISPTGGTGSGTTPATAWSLYHANNNLSAGNVACLLSGVYSIAPSTTINRYAIAPVNSGSSGSRIVYRAAPGAVPVITYSSRPTSSSYYPNVCIWLWRVSWIQVTGIVCRGSESGWNYKDDPFNADGYRVDMGARLDGASHSIISGNFFHYIGHGKSGSNLEYVGKGIRIQQHTLSGTTLNSDYNQIVGNSFSHIGCHEDLLYDPLEPCQATGSGGGWGDGIEIIGGSNYNVVKSNLLEAIGHNAITILGITSGTTTNYNVIQYNQVRNSWYTQIGVSELTGVGEARRNVIEANAIVLGASSPNKPIDPNDDGGIGIVAPQEIVRRNSIVGNLSGIALGVGTGYTKLFGNRIYHNAITGGLWAGFRLRLGVTCEPTSPYGPVDYSSIAFDNNLLVDNNAVGSPLFPSTFGGIAVPDLAESQVYIQVVPNGYPCYDPNPPDLQGMSFRNNLVVDDTPGKNVFNFNGWSLCRALSSFSGCAANLNGTFSNNLDGGEGRNQGAFLTTVATGGCATAGQVTVVDATYFTKGITDAVSSEVLVPGDEIMFDGDATSLRTVTGVSGNVLTLGGGSPALPASCANGKGVSIKYASTAPDIGPGEE
jgi:hypothetical protein